MLLLDNSDIFVRIPKKGRILFSLVLLRITVEKLVSEIQKYSQRVLYAWQKGSTINYGYFHLTNSSFLSIIYWNMYRTGDL